MYNPKKKKKKKSHNYKLDNAGNVHRKPNNKLDKIIIMQHHMKPNYKTKKHHNSSYKRFLS